MAQQPLPLPELASPAAISPWWPLAPGWWLLIITAVAIVLTIGVLLVRRHRRNRYRRAAKTALQQLQSQQQSLSLEQLCQQANALLKRTAIAGYGDNVASLSGDKWLHFICHHTDFEPANKTAIEQLMGQQYQPKITLEPAALFSACQQFIDHHRVPADAEKNSIQQDAAQAVVR
ncbi:hypothetical protein SIN8267_02871 [Sinobacterium norvegicum]|uniref:DUF4381 domain-containing protein n=1 Tax=Sinobacterium norvegicum TaxID=1641715 RepID=A0ABN8EK19_9GAMM|nr:DUF4381 domain-containing protein [Sinobacterium norvegicum]CAH0992735.1 hypothetical protein SIN8267_02871 [Sinobacterium norvegicum]